jgi:hypothetical protein
MRRLIGLAVFAALLLLPAAAQGEFGFKPGTLDVTFTDSGGGPAMQAGSHPFALTVSFEVNTRTEGPHEVPDEEFRDLISEAPPGLVGTATPVPLCSAVDFLPDGEHAQGNCPDSSAVGVAEVAISTAPVPAGSKDFLTDFPLEKAAVYMLEPPPGSVAKVGFIVAGVPVTIDVRAKTTPPYNVQTFSLNITQAVVFFGARFTIWGNPADPVHDPDRGLCADSPDTCPANLPQIPFLTMPRSCTGPLVTVFEARSWQNPGAWLVQSVESHDNSIPPQPIGVGGCSKLGFGPRVEAQTTNENADGPSGLDFELEVDDEGLKNPVGRAQSDIKKAVVTLPAGVTANPSLAEGLATCSPADLDRETLSSQPGEGCPQASKIGAVEVETPLLEGHILKGQLFIASQDDPTTVTPGAENPFDSLLAFYMVIKEPSLGVIVKQAAKVEPDPKTGQLVTTMDDIPQFPLSHVRIHLREGGRSPLVTPPSCDADPTTPEHDPYTTISEFTPWADPSATYTTTSDFEVTHGVGGGPCPSPGTLPFEPGFTGGMIDNNAGAFSPLYMRLTRRDGDQDLTKLSTTLAPGLVGKIAGVSKCSEEQIALARTKRGKEEIASPSCPQNSLIGRTNSGAGVGSQLTYVPGKLYLAGPHRGAPFSVVAIVPAVAGPFDVGTVVVRLALRINPQTAVATVDGSASDPIPHILAGIPLRLRDLRAYADRPQFTFNPTNCNPFAIGAELWGGGTDQFSVADDAPISRSAPFQAANCARLSFKPGLSIRLKGGTKRGGHPALRAVVTPRAGDANFAKAVVTLPRSAFLDQAHIRTICTRVQFAADACPKGAIYGFAKATTPILDEPVEGPVYLRSSNNKLPDLVMALQGPPSAPIDVEVVGRIDSHKGGIRSSFETIPDVPVSRFVLEMQGGAKGLIVNSRNLCLRKSRAVARLQGQNGRRYDFEPVVKAKGCSKAKASKRKARRRAH